jgi:hypothetical protein
MEEIELLRGVKFVYISQPIGEMKIPTTIDEHDSSTKNIETIWERDPGDGPWFDFGDPSSNMMKDDTVVTVDSASQTVEMFDLNFGVNKDTQTDAYAGISFANSFPIDKTIQLWKMQFVKTTVTDGYGYWYFGTHAGVKFSGIKIRGDMFLHVNVIPPQPLTEPGQWYDLVKI